MFRKLRAGALQFAMFVVVVIALLLAAFIVLVHTYKQFKIQTDFVLETANNANKGMDYLLEHDVIQEDTLVLNLNDADYKTLKVYQDYWGLFEKGTAISKIKYKQFKKIALIGASQAEIYRTALYLEENNRPLSLVGNTKIQGVAYLPKQGVRTGNISGHSYYGSSLINGATRESSELPKIKSGILKQLSNIDEEFNEVNQDQFLNIDRQSAFKNSFFNPLRVVYSPGLIDLSGVSLTGHILVQSKNKIMVDASSTLQDVILVAPIVELKDHVKGTFQVFATKELTVGSNCELNYPSALVLKEDKQMGSEGINNAEETPFIKINKGSTVKGTIVYLGKTKNYKPQVVINENAKIIGEVYCDRNLELLGDVYGSVFTSGFVAVQSGSVFQNHIYNGNILVDELPQEYVGLQLETSKKDIAKWLY